MKIPQDIIERIAGETDMVELVSEAVPLKRTGSNYKGLCPFHGEKTPSFTVSPHKRIFYCFGCGAGGDAIAFVMKREKLDFVEAVRKLADRLRIALPQSGADSQAQDERAVYDKINAYAQWFFRERYRDSPVAADYARGRGLSEKTVGDFELGFAPDGFDNLLGFFRQKGVPLEKALALGLVRTHEKSGRHYDFFRNRLMFPIRSQQGKVVGFGGRTLAKDADGAKYVNSPESPIYHKSRELYGLYQAKKAILASRRAVVVEGYVDVLACAQLGIDTAVAPLGTSLTADQVKLLKRFAEDVVLMFDGDAAGKAAALKAFATCLEAGVHPRVAVLPGGQDPGDMLRDPAGAAKLGDLVEAAPHAMDWVIAEAVRETGRHPLEQAKALKKIIYFVSRLPDPLAQATYRRSLQKYFDVAEADLNKVIEKTKEPANVPRPASERLTREELVILAFLNQPGACSPQELGDLSRDFEREDLGELAVFLSERCKNQETFTAVSAISSVPESLKAVLSRILAVSGSYGDLNVPELLRQNRQAARKKKLQRVTAKIVEAELSGDPVLKMQLLAEKQRLLTLKD